MRILFLTHSFNSLSQRLFVELTARGHEVSIEFDINDVRSIEAVEMYAPDVIVAPFLKRAIPEAIWSRHTCLVVHPGIVGDRGPSALDWAVANGEGEWGVTVLQANAEMDAGDIWAHARFPMREARKASLYRREVTEAAVGAVLQALERIESGSHRPRPLDYDDPDVRGKLNPPMRQADRGIDWQRDDTDTVLRKIRAADGFPGVADEVLGRPCYLYDAHREDRLRGEPGEVLATREGAICRATRDGAVWISHLRAADGQPFAFKLPATRVLDGCLDGIPEDPVACTEAGRQTYRPIRYEEANGVGYLSFDFYNGAMGTDHCQALLDAYREACRQDTRVIVLLGGADFWSNGIHLNLIEAATSPADESWRNINAMDDLAAEIILTGDRFTVAAMRGNAGAGGVFLALAADRVLARRGVVLNPHYKGMGNLYGSEYWTYLLPRRSGPDQARRLTEQRLPIGVDTALDLGLVDQVPDGDPADFESAVRAYAESVASDPALPGMLERKREQRARDEAEKPLAGYRAEELEHMRLNFYGFDPSYHVARYSFVHKRPHSWTPLHLAIHRRRVVSAA